ncbi:MAG: hypothetical protein H6673_02700 [Anaerolineales bacterium]|nr:hypothetical protein [Anaerolineales bacterium]
MLKRSVILMLALVMAFSAIGSIYAQDPTRPQAAADQARARAALNRLVVETAATALGMTPAEFIATVEVGQSYADVITANGGDLAQITADAKAAAIVSIDTALADGKITAEQAENMRANLDTALEQILNHPRADRDMRDIAIVNLVRITYQSAADALGVQPLDIIQNAEDGQSLNDYLAAQGADAAAVKAATVTSATEIINTALADGKINQEQADRLIAGLDAAIDRILDAPIPSRFDGQHAEMALDTAVMNHAAESLGVTLREVVEARRTGQSVADFVIANGGDPAATADATIAAVTERINTAVANGNLEQAQADAMIADLPAAVDAAMNSTAPLANVQPRPIQPTPQLNLGVGEAVAEALGLDMPALMEQLQAGKTLREIIRENSGDIDAITQIIKDTVSEAVQNAVANGEMLQERADNILNNLETFVQEALDRTPLRDRLGRGGFDDSGEGTGVLE